jgi:hypothetical protein
MTKKILIVLWILFFTAVTGLLVKIVKKSRKKPPVPEKKNWIKTAFWTIILALLSSLSKLLVKKTAKLAR